ncbi:MAG: ribosome small subunit-dependent GTPase A [Bdellovibrionaceae bacterium]|nr:ribosome small subunit-dependent GTPase A [Pseudobdellovibrionaceae bacterium]
MAILFRVVTDSGSHYGVVDPDGEFWPARLAGRFFNMEKSARPVVGDWVEGRLEPGGWVFVEERRPRQTLITRRVGRFETQDLAANVDLLLILSSLNEDFNLNRFDRYLALAHQAGIKAWIVLTKLDLCTDVATFRDEARARLGGVPLYAVSAETGEGIAELGEDLAHVSRAGGTIAVLGSSGVGKSTLTNVLVPEARMKTSAIREHDGRGRHTTTHREILRLADGGWWMDSPGLRGLKPEFGTGEVSAHTEDLEALILSCRFTDCAHVDEPGCRVRAAIAEGTLEEARWESFWKLKSEELHQERMEDPLERRKERERFHRQVAAATEHARFRRRGFK